MYRGCSGSKYSWIHSRISCFSHINPIEIWNWCSVIHVNPINPKFCTHLRHSLKYLWKTFLGFANGTINLQSQDNSKLNWTGYTGRYTESTDLIWNCMCRMWYKECKTSLGIVTAFLDRTLFNIKYYLSVQPQPNKIINISRSRSNPYKLFCMHGSHTWRNTKNILQQGFDFCERIHSQ